MAARPVHEVTIIGIATNNSSVKISYEPVRGAKDYRILDVGHPDVVKYAGMAHLAPGGWEPLHFVMQYDGVTPTFPYTVAHDGTGTGPATLDVPSNQIEWNNAGDGKKHTLIVQAVDKLGPAPTGNFYDDKLKPRLDSSMMRSMGSMLGSDEGMTADGLVSINGQGAPTNAPRVLAQSEPFVVQTDHATKPLPSRADASQVMLDTFADDEAASLTRVGSVDPSNGVMTYTLNAGTPKAWTIHYLGADTRDSMPMIESGHFMDTLFDGGTPGTSVPLHNSHGVMAMSPDQTADLSGGKLLHLTMEVDAHESGRRWVAFNLAPAADPLTNWYSSNAPINRSDRAFFAQFFPGMLTADVFNGPTSATNPTPIDDRIVGAAGQAPIGGYHFAHWGGNGLGLDNRSRFDLFLTTARFVVFEDGQLVQQAAIPGGLLFDKARVYFAHYLYHTDNDRAELNRYAPWEHYWLAQFPYSDERHWDNMGFEVLPPAAVPVSSDWASLALLVKAPGVTNRL